MLTLLSWGNLNGVVSSNIYRQQDAPNYRPGHGVVLAYLVLFLFLGSIVTTIGLRIENKKRLSGQRDHWVQGKNESEVDILGDLRYVTPNSVLFMRLMFFQARFHLYCVMASRLFVETIPTSN